MPKRKLTPKEVLEREINQRDNITKNGINIISLNNKKYIIDEREKVRKNADK